ncbi:MAG: YfhO family protein [Clostridia bacterium]|nr:YfhO family protein [Clostridia bacterium]
MSTKKRRSYSGGADSTASKENSGATRVRKMSSSFTTIYAPRKKVEGLNEKLSSNPLFLILCFLVPFIIMGVCFFMQKVYPFGDRTVLYSDLKAQYFPFLQELQGKLQNGGSLLYSWNTGMGSNFLAMIGYYIASPLNFLTVLVPQKYLSVALAVIIMTKLSCASLFLGVFIKKVFRRNDISLVAFGCCYAFSSFTMGYYWNIIWLDGVALLPLVALGVYELVYNKKYKLYIISLALTMIASYYIGFMVCVFTALWFFMLWIKAPKYREKKKDFFKSLLSIAIYSVIAIGISAIIVLPSYLQLANTVASDESLKFNEWFTAYNDKSMIDILGSVLGFHQPVTMQGLPNIYSGIAGLALFGVFLSNSKINPREKTVDLIFVLFMFFSLYFNGLNFLWHGLHFPNQIPYRFAFIFCFFIVIVGYRAFSMSEHYTSSNLASVAIMAILFVAIGFISVGSNTDTYATLTQKSVLYSMVALVIYAFIIALRATNLLPQKFFVTSMSIIIIIEMCMSCYTGVQTVGTSDMAYPNKLNAAEAALDYIAESDNDTDFYRIEMTDISSKNDGVYYGFKGVSQFSSTSDERVLRFMGKVGITAKRSSWHFMQTSPLVTSLFNIKHIISRDGYIADETNLSFVDSIEAESVKKNDDGSPITESVDLYDYNYYLPLGFMANDDIAEAVISSYKDYHAFDTQNDLFRRLTGLDGDIFSEFEAESYSISAGTIEPYESDKIGEYTYDAGNTNQSATFTYRVPKDGMVYAYANFRDCATRIKINSETISHEVDIDARRYVWPAGNYKAGDIITFTSDLSVGDSGLLRLYVATFDKELFEQGYEMLSDETMDISEFNDTNIKGTINAKTDGVMWTSIPYEVGGWTLFVDGQEQEITSLCDAFIGVELDAGEHSIELKYQPPGFKAGVIISLVSLLAFVALCTLEIIKKKKEVQNTAE